MVHTTRRGLAATPKARATSVRATGSLAARRNASEAVQSKERRSLPFPLNKRTVAVKPLSAVQDMSSSALGNAGEVNQRPTVLVSEKLGAAGIELLEKFANVECCYDLSVDELHQKISLCDA